MNSIDFTPDTDSSVYPLFVVTLFVEKASTMISMVLRLIKIVSSFVFSKVYFLFSFSLVLIKVSLTL